MLTPFYCKKCGKEFYPTPEHAYKDHTGMYCCWTHFNEHRKARQNKYKKVIALNREHVELITYPSASYAARVMNCEASGIQSACREGTFYMGYFWRYADDNKEKGEN